MSTGYADDAAVVRPPAAMSSDAQPAWVAGELPEEYAEIATQIAALKEQAARYERVSGALWQTGPALTASVRDLFTALEFGAELAAPGANYDLVIDLESGRRLLVEVVSNPTEAIDRRSPHIARILRVLQEDAAEKDRVVLAANVFSSVPVAARRQDPVTVEAMRLIQGLGANFVPTSALFGIWKSSMRDLPSAKRSIMKLYSMDGGIFR